MEIELFRRKKICSFLLKLFIDFLLGYGNSFKNIGAILSVLNIL